MSYSPRQWRAISHYVKKNNLRPELSAYPLLRFTNRETGEQSSMDIMNIELIYDSDREKAKREAASARKAENRKAKRGA